MGGVGRKREHRCQPGGGGDGVRLGELSRACVAASERVPAARSHGVCLRRYREASAAFAPGSVKVAQGNTT